MGLKLQGQQLVFIDSLRLAALASASQVVAWGEIARIRNVSVEDVAMVTSENAKRFFGLP